MIYFVQEENGKHIKIGFTSGKTVEERSFEVLKLPADANGERDFDTWIEQEKVKALPDIAEYEARQERKMQPQG